MTRGLQQVLARFASPDRGEATRLRQDEPQWRLRAGDWHALMALGWLGWSGPVRPRQARFGLEDKPGGGR
jgi:hypothetical protein